MNTRITLRVFNCLLVLLVTGCTTSNYRSAILYKQIPSDVSKYERPSIPSHSNLIFNGNVIQVPRGKLAQFELTELKLGWLSEKSPAIHGLEKNRLLPEKALWLVTQIEGFKPDDFLRTSSKRSFIATAVKQNQNSLGYLPLDAAETGFSLQTSDFQYEVTFTLYSVDNFRLKQALGFAVKDNEGLIKIGVDALKKMGGTTYSFIADPFIRSLKHEYGESFMFERVLLTAGAVTEFKGTVYIIGDKDSAKEAKGSYVLSDLSDVGSKSKLLSLRKEYDRMSAGESEALKEPSHDRFYQTAYSNTLDAINEKVDDVALRDGSARVLRFELSSHPDRNKEIAGLTERVSPFERQKKEAKGAISQTIGELGSLRIDKPLADLENTREQLENVLNRIISEDADQLNAASDLLIKSLSKQGDAESASLASARKVFELPEDAPKKDVIAKAKEVMSKVGVVYVATLQKPLQLKKAANPPVVSVLATGKALTVLQVRTNIETAIKKIDGVKSQFESAKLLFQKILNLESIKEFQSFMSGNEYKDALSAFKTEFGAVSGDDLLSQVSLFDPFVGIAERSEALEYSLKAIADAEESRARIIKDAGSAGAGGGTIF